MTVPYFFFRPLISADRGWAAIDWQTGAPETTDNAACLHCFKQASATQVANLLPLILSVQPHWLEQPTFIEGFDASQVILILPADSLDNNQTLARCKDLSSQGYRLGLHVDSTAIVRKIPLSSFDYLSFTATFARHELQATELAYINDAGFRKIATHVDSHEMFNWLSEKSFELCSSGYLTTRNPAFGREPDLTRLKLLKLLQLVQQDGDTHEIEAIFREEPKLSYNLLRLVNSVAVGARIRISNFSQAIAILGRRQLQRWLQLLIYANNLADGNAPNPLMQLAAQRGRLIELLCKSMDQPTAEPENCDKAFMTGLFSLLDVLINLPMDEVLKDIPLEEDVMAALISPTNGSMLGQLLSAVLAGESGNFTTAEAILAELGISPAMHAEAQVAALTWASRINIDNHD